MNMKPSSTICPCGSGAPIDTCCEPFISGKALAPTAEALMRSRYTAYALLNQDYLLDTWHRSSRPPGIKMDPATQWIRLKILSSEHDRVEFIATYRINGKAHTLHESSRFINEAGRWFYLGGILETG